jgi:1-acyl-sn-glycerol-3-phosphate acyltransferase
MAWALAFVRSLLHMGVMFITVIPYAVAVLLASLLGASGQQLYRIAVQWLKVSIHSARWLLGIHYRIHGYEHLPLGETSPAILLVKHQSTYETFLMPVIMPHPLAYVFKKELLYIPFFGWAIGRLDMIHIDRSQRARAFAKVVEQGRALLDKGVWVIMFPEGTRIPRGQAGQYKSGGARLAVATDTPIIPIAVTSGRCWPRRAFVKFPGVVDVSIGAPIASTGRDADELMRDVEQWIEGEMHRLDPEAYAKAAPPEGANQP